MFNRHVILFLALLLAGCGDNFVTDTGPDGAGGEGGNLSADSDDGSSTGGAAASGGNSTGGSTTAECESPFTLDMPATLAWSFKVDETNGSAVPTCYNVSGTEISRACWSCPQNEDGTCFASTAFAWGEPYYVNDERTEWEVQIPKTLLDSPEGLFQDNVQDGYPDSACTVAQSVGAITLRFSIVKTAGGHKIGDLHEAISVATESGGTCGNNQLALPIGAGLETALRGVEFKCPAE